jgi:DNA-binding NarL/FixJ family response regulator
MPVVRKTRVLVADDHTIVRQGLRAVLEREPDIEVVGEAADGREAVRKAVALVPDIVVMDVSMPALNGLEATARIVREVPRVNILALTMHSSEEYVYSFLKAGAKGYLLKESAASDLVEAIRAVRFGGTYLHPTISVKVINEYLKLPDPRSRSGQLALLTEREREVLQLIAEGHTNKGIADLLSLSVKTVEAHRSRVMEKLKIHNVAGLTRYAISRGITSITSPGSSSEK